MIAAEQKARVTYDNILQPIVDTLQKDPLANRYANQNLLPVIYGSATPITILGIKSVAINHPALLTNTWYVTGLNLEYDLGIFWNLCSTGWYRYRFYSLNPDLSLEKLKSRSTISSFNISLFHAAWSLSNSFPS